MITSVTKRELLERSSLHTAPNKVMRMTTEFYSTLFTVEPVSQDILHAWRIVLHTMHASLTPSMCLALDTPFSELELQRAVSAIDASSCPRDDGLSKFFFSEFWDVLKAPLLLGIQHIFDTGYMPPSITASIFF